MRSGKKTSRPEGAERATWSGGQEYLPCPFRAQLLYCLIAGAESPRLYPPAATRPGISLHAIRVENIRCLWSAVGQISPRSGVIPTSCHSERERRIFRPTDVQTAKEASLAPTVRCHGVRHKECEPGPAFSRFSSCLSSHFEIMRTLGQLWNFLLDILFLWVSTIIV